MLGLRDYIWENTRFTVRSSAKHLTMFGLFGIALSKRRAEKKRIHQKNRVTTNSSIFLRSVPELPASEHNRSRTVLVTQLAV